MSKYVGFRLGKVHESHVISEYYCGGCGWPVTDHDSFCPECGGAFCECDASNLEAENDKLSELDADLWEAFRLGGPWVAHSEYMRVKAENAKLREDMEDLEGYDQMLRDRLRQETELQVKDKAENAKLRELVRTLHYCTSSGECDGCPVNSDGTAHLMPDDICDTMLDRMHELGVVE